MKRLQKLGYMAIGAALSLTLSVTIPVVAASIQKQLTVYYNGTKIYVDGELITPMDGNGKIVEPFVSDGTTYLPVAAVAKALGKSVEYDSATTSVYIGQRPGTVQYMTDVCPAYQSTDENYYKEYSAINSGGVDRFSMAGETYLNGFTMQGRGHITQSFFDTALWNLNGQYTSMTATLGHVDGTPHMSMYSAGDGAIRIFCDGVLNQEIELTGDMAPRSVSIDLRGVNQLKISWDFTSLTDEFGFGNPVLE